MYSKFENLEEEKKKRIIDACIQEFSQHGYKNASTNNIVRTAEISKGILFHYFGNKKSLYLYVFKYVKDLLSDIIYSRMTDLPADFFERSVRIGVIKLKAAYEYPAEYKFLIDAITHAPEEAKLEIQKVYGEMVTEGMPVIFKDIDTSRFRKDIDKNKTMKLISLIMEGISNKYLKDFRDMPTDEIINKMETLVEETYECVEILKYGVYEPK